MPNANARSAMRVERDDACRTRGPLGNLAANPACADQPNVFPCQPAAEALRSQWPAFMERSAANPSRERERECHAVSSAAEMVLPAGDSELGRGFHADVSTLTPARPITFAVGACQIARNVALRTSTASAEAIASARSLPLRFGLTIVEARIIAKRGEPVERDLVGHQHAIRDAHAESTSRASRARVQPVEGVVPMWPMRMPVSFVSHRNLQKRRTRELSWQR